ncbi:MAG TPA: transcription antiterminator [Firmicutes bacterium]|nr:transcription antiterminator [Candidatus Fermentithermobacillaceae bacterium]
MMNTEALKPRSARLLKILLESDKPIPVDALARQFSVSPRTIRYDLVSARRWVQSRGMNLVVQPRVGIKLTGNPDQVLRDLSEAQKPSYQAPLLVNDRRKAILLILLQAQQPVSLTALADSLFVSRSTVKSDVAILKRELAEQGVFIKHRPGVGHYVEGDEAVIRRLMVDLYFEKTRNGLEMVVWADLIPDSRLLPQNQLDAVWQLAGSFRIETRLCLDPTTFGRFVAMLAVSIRRALLGYKVEMPGDRTAKIVDTKEYSAVARLGERIRETIGVELSPGDIALVTAFLMEMGETFEVDVAPSEDRAMAARFSKRFIEELEKRLAVDLSGDAELQAGIRAHILRVVRLLRLGIATPNPLLPDIKRQYPEAFEACLEADLLVSKEFGIETSEDEAGYLCMHVGAAMERKKKKPTRVLVCTNGVSSAKLLSARLLRHFKDIEIADVVPVSQVMEYPELDQIDLIVSSVPFKILRDMVVVNPLLNEEDIAVLESRGLMRARQADAGAASQVELVRSIMQAVTSRATVDDVQGLQEAILEILRGKQEAQEGRVARGAFDTESAAAYTADTFKKMLPEAFSGVPVAEIERRSRLAMQRLTRGGGTAPWFSRHLAGVSQEAVNLAGRVLGEFGRREGVVFAPDAPLFLAACVMEPSKVPLSVVEVGLLVSRDLAFGPEDAGVLERLLLAAHDGARKAGLTLKKDVLFDLALHLASTLILGEESGALKEMAFHAAGELTPEMASAGKAMAALMTDVLGRPLEKWEETYLALYAGASLIRDEGLGENEGGPGEDML